MESNNESELKDSIVEEAVEKMRSRSQVGINKYGVTLDRKDMSTVQWIDMAIEEQMDNIMYLTRLKKDIEKMEALFHKKIESNTLDNITPFCHDLSTPLNYGVITTATGTLKASSPTHTLVFKANNSNIEISAEPTKELNAGKKRYGFHR